jgi:hypothetical protein
MFAYIKKCKHGNGLNATDEQSQTSAHDSGRGTKYIFFYFTFQVSLYLKLKVLSVF